MFSGKMIKRLEENIGENLHDPGFGEEILHIKNMIHERKKIIVRLH